VHSRSTKFFQCYPHDEHKPGSVNEGDLFIHPRSGVFDHSLLRGDQAVHELGSLLLVGIHALRQHQFANTGSIPRFAGGDSLNRSQLDVTVTGRERGSTPARSRP
jgi:hypothetical protein